MSTTIESLETLSYLAAHLQRPYSAVRRAADALNLLPELRLNGVDHFSGEQAQAIAAYLATPRPPESVDELRLSVRSLNVLERAGIETVAQLVSRSATELRIICAGHESCVLDITTAMEKIGLHLATEAD